MDEKQRSFILERFFFGWKMGVTVFDKKDVIVGIWSGEHRARACAGRDIGQFSESVQELYRRLRDV